MQKLTTKQRCHFMKPGCRCYSPPIPASMPGAHPRARNSPIPCTKARPSPDIGGSRFDLATAEGQGSVFRAAQKWRRGMGRQTGGIDCVC